MPVWLRMFTRLHWCSCDSHKNELWRQKHETVHSDCPLFNKEIWSDYKISAGSRGFTWIFLLTSTFHPQIATHKEPCSPYPTWASCYLSVHRKMKEEWRNVATSNSGFKKNKGLTYSAAYYGTLSQGHVFCLTNTEFSYIGSYTSEVPTNAHKNNVHQ